MSKCEICGSDGAMRRHQHTAYTTEEKNYRTLCGPCQNTEDEFWDEKWAELHEDILLGIKDAEVNNG